jgi:hypothetical protein
MAIDPTNVSNKPKWVTPIESRIERADYYFQTILQNQHEWYSEKAGAQKRRHLFFAISVIVLGGAISCLQVIQTDFWIKCLTAGLGASISILRAIDALLRPGETWQGYRKASENMKREYRLYINNATIYDDASDEEAAYLLLVERVETVLAEEQQLFWQYHAKSSALQSSPIPETEEKQEPIQSHTAS